MRGYKEVEEEMKENPLQKYNLQQYISSPLLLDGFKFDLRVYVTITSLFPLRAHVFRDGLARLCTQPYEAPTEENRSLSFMHLTNYSLNKKSENFKRAAKEKSAGNGNTSGGEGEREREKEKEKEKGGINDEDTEEVKNDNSSKRRIPIAFRQLSLDEDLVWSRIDDLLSKMLLAIWPRLIGSYLDMYGTDEEKAREELNSNCSRCFHTLGVDVLLDSELEPWLLEINANPSLGTDSFMDLRIKQGVVERSLQLVGLLPSDDETIRRESEKTYRGKEPELVGRPNTPIYISSTTLHRSTRDVDFTALPFSSLDPFTDKRWSDLSLFTDRKLLEVFISEATRTGSSKPTLAITLPRAIKVLKRCGLNDDVPRSTLSLFFEEVLSSHKQTNRLSFSLFADFITRVAQHRSPELSSADAVRLLLSGLS